MSTYHERTYVKTGNIGTRGFKGPSISHPSEITADVAGKVFSYDPETGVICRKIVIGGKPVGPITQIDRYGYVKTSFMGKQLRGHRLAWLPHYGSFPEKGLQIDHINMDRADNRIANLRAVSVSVNQCNIRKSHSQSRLGLLGVSAANSKFQATITMPGIGQKYLGVFDTPELAHKAYMDAKRVYQPEVFA